MAFDWVAFLNRMGVEYVERGPNVARDHINIACPFCGPADHSHHMGLSLEGKGWGCWRDDSHRGRRPERLVMALARCSWDEAKAIIEDGATPTDVGWEALKKKLTAKADLPVGWPPLPKISLPEEFFPIDSSKGFRGRFLAYLRGRGFPKSEAKKLARYYDLRGAVVGPFKERLIFPITHEDDLVGWTGRAIIDAKVRYKTHPSGGDFSTRVLFNYDAAKHSGGRILAICEGPFDAVKVDFYGKSKGVRAIALLGLFLTPSKISLLLPLSERFETIVLMLDSTAIHKALDFSARLSWLKSSVKVGHLPPGVKDPGDLDADDVVPLFKNY